MYHRCISKVILDKIGKGKVIILTGARQVGKTTLLNTILNDLKYLFLDGDDPTVRSILTYPNTEQLRSLIGDYKLVFIDEAQRIDGIGLTVKILFDQFKDIQIVVSGSSSFELSNELNEPLTGRKWEFNLYPISWEEFEKYHGFLVSEQQLENRLLYGFYPDVLNNPGQERDILKNLVNSYLYRDILAYSDIRKPEILEKLVQALALQIGNEVSYNELSQIVGVDKSTISKYIDLLQKGFVLFKLSSFSRNIRNEIKTNKKIYFFDNGIRNMIIGNFTSLELRTDKGALWENFLISERIKQNMYKNNYAKTYFWRTKQQQEIDFVEEVDGKLKGYEFKWKAKKNVKIPKSFLRTYGATGKVISRDNFREFVVIPITN